MTDCLLSGPKGKDTHIQQRLGFPPCCLVVQYNSIKHRGPLGV